MNVSANSCSQNIWGGEYAWAPQKPDPNSQQSVDGYLPSEINYASARQNGVSHDGMGHFYRDGKAITANEVNMWSRL